jgi:DNA-binding XRE family transcriptional regulator
MNEAFCKKLKELRAESGVSQLTMAKGIGTYQQTIARWEKGITEPDTEMIAKICLYFNVSADYLLGLH